jgi:hypothetical protein
MANKHLLFRVAARGKILHGATALADAVEKVGREGTCAAGLPKE